MNPQPIDPPTQSTWRHVPAKTHTTIHKEFASEKQGTEWIKLVLRPSVLGLNAHTRAEAGTAAHFLTQRDPAVKEPKKKGEEASTRAGRTTESASAAQGERRAVRQRCRPCRG
jgi:hypothetical protein